VRLKQRQTEPPEAAGEVCRGKLSLSTEIALYEQVRLMDNCDPLWESLSEKKSMQKKTRIEEKREECITPRSIHSQSQMQSQLLFSCCLQLGSSENICNDQNLRACSEETERLFYFFSILSIFQ
jgi:hypothetical protein